jgi:aryl-alcohol dehydrogenase-like predicted oxidoreductase
MEPNFSRIMKLIENLSEIASGLNVTLSQLVLNWTLRQPGITCALAGARNADQVLENVRAADFKLNNEEIARINNYLTDLKLETKI